MYTFLSNKENSFLNNWEIYRERKQPLIVFVNEINNIVIIHETIKYAKENGVTIQESLMNVIGSLQLYPYTIETKTREVLSLNREILLKEMDEFGSYLKESIVNDNWTFYSNLSGRSSVVKYRIGTDYIDVVFSSSITKYYHYAYKITGILTTELFKFYAKQGRYLGTNTRKINKGRFELYSLE